MKYCKICLYPDTKPDLTFDSEGVCSACRAYEARGKVDWKAREEEFHELVNWAKGKHAEYDCIIPVSGGKDSFYQTVKALDYGLKPLLVNARTDFLTELGRDNLDSISSIGADFLQVVPDQSLRYRICKYTLETVGDISWPEHVSIFTIPVRVAIEKRIPLILWGENSQSEYGGPKDWQEKSDLVADRWLSEFGGLNGLRVSDVAEAFDIPESRMSQYFYPTDASMVTQKFLGYYFPWDGVSNAHIAAEYGFNESVYPIETSGWHHENCDNAFTGIHDIFKYYKYGFGRSADICSSEIRRGRMTRTEGVEHCRIWEGKPPISYLGISLDDILEPLGMQPIHLKKIANVFANSSLFSVKQNYWPSPKFEIE